VQLSLEREGITFAPTTRREEAISPG
jgi:hypothetical protein